MLSNIRKDEIESTVSNIITENAINYSMFDITKFLTNTYKFKIGVQDLEKNTTGMLLVDDDKYIPNTDTNRLIVVNRDLDVEDEYIYNLKKRFIIAHEFAHFILHKNDNVQFAHRDNDKRGTLTEEEADYFARCLLMPKNLVTDWLSINEMKGQDLSAKANIISRLFSVTLTKAKDRIKELGLA